MRRAGEFELSLLAPEKSHLSQDSASFKAYTLCSPTHLITKAVLGAMEIFLFTTGIFQAIWTELSLSVDVDVDFGAEVTGASVL